MISKRSVEDGPGGRPTRTSDRLRRRPKIYGRSYLCYPNIRKKPKTKRRTAASQIAKLLRPGRIPHTRGAASATKLRRSTRKRKTPSNLEDYDTDSSERDEYDLTGSRYPHPSRAKLNNRASQADSFDSPPVRRKISENNKTFPRREGLRPRPSRSVARKQSFQESDDDQHTAEERIVHAEEENGKVIEEEGAQDEGEPDAEAEDEGEGGDEGEEDGDDEDGEEEEHEGRRRYDLRDRSEVRRFYPNTEGKKSQRLPRRVLHQGMGARSNQEVCKGGSRVHKRHSLTRTDDSDDSLLVDELDQGPGILWGRGGSRSGAPWLFGGMDLHGSMPWGLNVAASGWGHQGDSFTALTTGVQTAGPSSKGGADIQPLQVDESVSFADIGGLSDYIDALKEMVFFPLLYPDFFANYHITPPRGVLLCGPPGTGKTLIARALASAASKAGQKVSFYMRKGADVLSKWVGEAERQLKLLFEEAQRNQPSIIFFDEIDGLAPVRSSKQEQIHNSIVSTLLALMDGLDSRGQVVLIGATNRIDAIDGALRRPGRFDREFTFPLPGCEARAEILDIHTRKWKEPPPKKLKMELAARCVGYCGADLKALCTEAAIRAFREKYPQVYTSDDKFVIDVNSVKIEKYHFLEAMSAITPAAHRGSTVHSRPLSAVVAPCLERHLREIMDHVSKKFPSLVASDLTKLPVYGSAVPLVYRPRLLVCGAEGVGLDHVGPAVLHELEKFPVHSLGLPSLLSDPSAKTPEEALVHIFAEARRTTPSILYLPQFQLWWETAHEQLKAVLLTLLEELPSDFPILLFGTSSVSFTELDEQASSVFSSSNMYQLGRPSTEDRSMVVERLVEALFSIPSEPMDGQSKAPATLPELPKAPKAVSGLKASELKAKAEAEQHALRRLRMCLRDVCNRVLYDKRFSMFHYPVLDEDAPDYRSIVQNPMDMATLLQRVDSGQYLTCSSFLQDIDVIVSNAKAYNRDDYNGARIVSRAHELRDAVQGMLSQMDPVLGAFCDKIAAQGGPVSATDDMDPSLPATPVVQLSTITRTSARLRHVQPEVNLCQSYEALKRQKRSADAEQPGSTNSASTNSEDKSRPEGSELTRSMLSQSPPSQSGRINGGSKGAEDDPTDGEMQEDFSQIVGDNSQLNTVMGGENSSQVEDVKRRLMERTEGYGVPQLERLYSRMITGVVKIEGKEHRMPSILSFLLNFVEDEGNF